MDEKISDEKLMIGAASTGFPMYARACQELLSARQRIAALTEGRDRMRVALEEIADCAPRATDADELVAWLMRRVGAALQPAKEPS